MKPKRRKKPRVYTLSDLAAMADQLGCRITFAMVPVEQRKAMDARFAPVDKGTPTGSAEKRSS